MTTPEVHSARVLVHAPIGRDAQASADLLGRAGITADLCATLAEVVHGLRLGAAAVFVAEEALFGKDISALSTWVEEQPPWSDLPFVVVTSRHEHPAVVSWRQQLAAILGNVSLLERPLQAITLTSTVQAAVRARRRQYEVRALLEDRVRAAAELEALVEARTSELEESNHELRRHIAERTRVEEALRLAQKMEAVGQLTGGVAHDFNNLLMVISSGLDLLARHADPVRRQRLMDRMRQATQRGAALTRQLLAFSRRQALKPEAVDLARQVGGMRELLRRSLRGDVDVQLDFADDLWPVEVDPGELELMLLNLAVNARDAMPVSGTIVLRAENAPAERVDNCQGDFVRLSVIDSGVGMSPEVKARAFEPFFTTKEIGKGSGLGLAQVYGFARQSGGTVLIDTEVGKGTCVTVVLPRSTNTPAADHHSTGQSRLLAESSGCVLLVEDDDEVAALVAEMLKAIGYDVTRAASAESALGALANSRGIDVVFSDVMMPGGMDGIALAREIRARRPGLPVLLTSGYAEAAKRAAEAEGVRLLAKPYALDELANALTASRESAMHG
jgi:signal transduction histidine kinase/CheY-like chemotaxis protein